MAVDIRYALGQLERAVFASTEHGDPAVRERARARVAQWRRVLEGMASGALAIGSRTPTAAPAWATLEVVHGGFATGGLAADVGLLQALSEAGREQGADVDIRAHEHSVLAGALGAAIWGAYRARKLRDKGLSLSA